MTMTSEIVPRDPVTGEIDDEWLAEKTPEEADAIRRRFYKPVPQPGFWARLWRWIR